MHLEDMLGFEVIICQEPMCAVCCLDFEAEVLELFCDIEGSGLVCVGYGQEDSAVGREILFCGLLGFEEGKRERIGQAEHFTGRAHLRPENRVDFRKHIEREDGFLYAKVLNGALL
ncbi:hypothetical protein ES703_101630 [subsurface metagenome]